MENLITEIDILEEAKDNFLTYAEEVLTDRSIPSIEDGLLSVQRKLLWTAEEILKMNNKGKTKKCASLVGSTLASSYFHGDAACYGALCKMAQTYLMRYPLIDGQGSLGTQEANGMQASARYTEAKPSKYTDLMFEDFSKNVIPLKETYNGEYMEPVYLPSLFPNALVNGREAIGISMSHNSLPACLTEVCDGIIEFIKREGKITVEELMKFIKGPDFPLGGQVINSKDILAAYKTGHSSTSLKVRGDYEIDGQKIIFTSIPYRTYRNQIKEQITKNIEEFDKFIDDFNDESSTGNNRLIFEVKKGISVSEALNKIFALTDLQTTLSYNMNFIVNGTPKLCSLYDLVEGYYNHQIEVLVNATNFDKDKAEKRVHILEGLILAIDKIDEVIALIKKSSNKAEARTGLINFLNIDSIQADAILDMKLAKLTKIDKDELVNELKEKREFITECVKILTDKNYRDNILISKITNMRDKYGDKRRTRLDNIEIPKEEEVMVEPQKCVVVFTKAGNIKRINADNFRVGNRNTKGVKTQDDITDSVIRTNTVDKLMVFTNKGTMYRLLVDEIPEGTNSSKGVPISSLISFGANEIPQIIYSIYKDTEAKYVLFTTKNGIVKKTPLEEFIGTKKKSGVIAIKLKENDSLASISLVKDEDIIILTKNGHGIRFNTKEIPATGRAAVGIKGISLNENDLVITTLVVRDSNDDLALFNEKGLGMRLALADFAPQGRGGKGLIYYKDGITTASLVNDNDNLLVIGNKSSICISAKDISKLSRGSIGIKIIKDNQIISATKI